ncbi:hypothetical protein K493DRAFT_332368 [Basidiobolus meristosporus CBS 931.73]|uniref:Uncharacterized protein n=1 Tax=Basidiobolus meristosporus CBS 931.73 TaxID=1314790 RepID=A0A1Y1ZDU8_9FUNG|nr:hypothetical protein K493DRAFT_332368 [Basidiobolus meristosporus CBS 931.73]|eukprot:ORY08421.1 hypothetical protein K493DRAFT_332368 [Basidiobolus meristosporus CBS 931.73]
MDSTQSTIPLLPSEGNPLPTNCPKSSQKPSPSFLNIIASTYQGNIEANIRAMDSLFNTNFHEWIRNDRNVHCIALRLRSMDGEFELRQLANVMQWIAAGWPENRCRTLFQLITASWSESRRRRLASELLLSGGSTKVWSPKSSENNCARCYRPRVARSMRLRAGAPFTYLPREELKRTTENPSRSTSHASPSVRPSSSGL